MQNLIKKIIDSTILLIHSSSCVFYPHAVDIPLIQEKKDLRIDAGISTAVDAGATVSYGLTEKVAVQGYGSFGVDNVYYFQGAFGFYKNTGNNNILEWYNGFGTGYANAPMNSTMGDLFGNYYLGFTQINYGKVNSNPAHLDYGISFKTGFFSTNLTDRSYYKNYYFDENFDGIYPTLNTSGLLFQPVAFVRLGGEKLKFNFKVGGLWLYQFNNKNQQIPTGNFNVALGLNYYVNLRKSKQ